jgi:hypothetical protein
MVFQVKQTPGVAVVPRLRTLAQHSVALAVPVL